ncbi:hypothetical protein Ddc_17683 [Ditylenchus destructor]|nr:hypothetical protein Ddc_17683 [Ditylenchus destructor]
MVRRIGICSLNLLLLTVSFGAVYGDIYEQFFRQTKSLINDAVIAGSKVRQCTCEEQNECIKEMDAQSAECVETCWSGFSQIVTTPQDLRKCFTETDHIVKDFTSCFAFNFDACSNATAESVTQKVDIAKFFGLGFERVHKTMILLGKQLSAPLRKVLTTSGNFMSCLNECFVNKNSKGFCFDKKSCQPTIIDTKSKSFSRLCPRLADWKKKGGEICDCSTKAGLTELKPYCPMLRQMADKRSSKKQPSRT